MLRVYLQEGDSALDEDAIMRLLDVPEEGWN